MFLVPFLWPKTENQPLLTLGPEQLSEAVKETLLCSAYGAQKWPHKLALGNHLLFKI